jgi:hypothetical protein
MARSQGAGGQPNAGLNPSIMQKGQPGTVQAPPPTEQQGHNMEAQARANDAQQEVKERAAAASQVGRVFTASPR